jgi:hypothetical protein
MLIGILIVLSELSLLGAFIYTVFWETPMPVLVSCPECKRLVERGGFQTWQLVCMIGFSPWACWLHSQGANHQSVATADFVGQRKACDAHPSAVTACRIFSIA